MMILSMYTRYFMFSQEHYDQLKIQADKNGDKSPQLGKVLVRGNYKYYTAQVRDPEAYTKRYADAKIVTSGDIRKTYIK